MLQRLVLFVSILLLSIAAYSQSSNWNTAIDLNVTADRHDRVDLYTDADGNHVIIQESNQLTYYLFDAEGAQIRTSTRDNNVAESPV